MSRKLVKTSLKGFTGPLNVQTGKFQNLLDSEKIPINAIILEKICKRVDGYIEERKYITADKYEWFWGCTFCIAGCGIALLIPWSQDWKKKNKSQADRSIAIYSKGKIETIELRILIKKLCDAYEAVRKEAN